jgi:hypothetical protein
MRAMLELDDALGAEAMSLTGINDISLLIREASTAVIQRGAARRLAALGGSEPQAAAIPRRQTEPRRQRRNAGVPFDFAQGRLLHSAMDDDAVHRSGRDDASLGR